MGDRFYDQKTKSRVTSGKNSANVEFDLSKVGFDVAEYINDNAEEIAKQIAIDARSSNAFQDYKGTDRESNRSKLKYSNGRKLRKSIKAKESKFDDGGWIVIVTAPHAHLIEYGHGGESPAPAHPFLRPALGKNISLAINKFGAK